MRAISLFAGIGGFDLALERLGHKVVYASEWDKYSALIYEKNFGKKPDTRDIKSVGDDEIPDHDILVGGFPCQTFSIAGKRGGFSDTRGTLFFDIARILRNKRPRYFLLENVKGLLSHEGGKTFQTILGVLTDLGYELQWQILNSKDFGVPQNRERIIIVGSLGAGSRPEIFPFGYSHGEDLLQTPEISASGQGVRGSDISATIDANYHKGSGSTRQFIGTYRTYKDGGGFREMKSGLSPTLPARARNDGSGSPILMVALTEVRTEEAKKIRSEALKTGKDFSPRRGKDLVPRTDGKIGALTASRNLENIMLGPMGIRRLTPVECERLQGFPDNWTAGVSDTQRYKQLGNAVTVNVVYEVLKKFPKD